MADSQPIAQPPLPIVSGVEFRYIKGFPGYCVGDDGSVWSCRINIPLYTRRGFRGAIGDAWHSIKACLMKDCYGVQLHQGSTKTTRKVHDLVLTAFVGPRPPGMQGCHFPDRDIANNKLSNLRWDTPAANMRDRDLHGMTCRGERHHEAKLTVESVLAIRADKSGETQAQIGKRYGVHQGTIGKILLRQSWKHVKDNLEVG